MPRFFFNIFDGHGHRDEEGTELPDWQAAQTLAIRHVGEVLQTDARRISPGHDWRMEVTDERGLILLRLDFNVLASSAAASASAVPKGRMPFDPEAL